MFTRDVRKAIEFYTRVLGLRLSDRSSDNIAFLHGIHGSDHHMIAFARSDAPGHHHFSWDVGSVDEIGAGAMHMLDKGFAKGWGLGRHVLGSNYFHYVQDPWGSFSEYSADIDYIPATCDWPAAIIRRKIRSMPGARTFRRTSSTITRPERLLRRSPNGARLASAPLRKTGSGPHPGSFYPVSRVRSVCSIGRTTCRRHVRNDGYYVRPAQLDEVGGPLNQGGKAQCRASGD